MRKHCRTVHEKRRDHACPYCPGVAFGQKSNLTRHLGTAHADRQRGDRDDDEPRDDHQAAAAGGGRMAALVAAATIAPLGVKKV